VACRRRSRSWLTSFMCRLMSSPSRRGLPPIRRPTRFSVWHSRSRPAPG
jgi:hypothetical protein